MNGCSGMPALDSQHWKWIFVDLVDVDGVVVDDDVLVVAYFALQYLLYLHVAAAQFG